MTQAGLNSEQQAFMAFGQQHAPFASGRPLPMTTGFDNLPFFRNNPMIGMIAQPLLQGLMGRYGLTPMGLNDQNMFDQMHRMRMTQLQQRVVNDAAQGDRQNYMQLARGIANLRGTPWGSEQIANASAIADAAVFATPMMAMMAPSVLDELNGIRGSRAVMATQMFQGGRFRVDPLSGLMGMSGDSISAGVDDMYERLFVDGKIGDMQGLGAGRVGELYREMTLRGMIRGPEATVGERTRSVLGNLQQNDANLLRDVLQRNDLAGANINNLSATDIDKLVGDEEVGGRLRSLDTERATQSIQNYIGAVSAVRDIFGDMGRPNAPMSELLNMLEALSGGAMAQINPARLTEMVRNVRNLTEITGVTMTSALALQQHAGTRLTEMGLSPAFSANVRDGALAFGGAYRSMGMNSYYSWGRYDESEMMQLDTNLRANAIGSASANRAAVALRLVNQAVSTDETGTAYGLEALEQNSDLYNYISTLQTARETGATQFSTSEGMRSLNVSRPDLLRMLQGAQLANGGRLNVTEGQFLGMLGQEFTNQGLIQQYDLGNTVARPNQFETDIGPALSMYARSGLQAMLMDPNGAALGRDAAGQLSQTLSRGLIGDMRNLSEAQLNDTDLRTEAMVGMLRTRMTSTAAGRNLLAGMTPDQQETYLRTMSSNLYGQLNDDIRNDPNLRAHGNLVNTFTVHNERVQSQMRMVQQQAQVRSQMQEALAPMRGGSALRRVINTLMTDDDVDLPTLIGRAFGGISNSETQGALQGQFEIIQNKVNAVRDLEANRNRTLQLYEAARRDYESATSDNARSEAQTRMDALNQQIQTHDTSLGTAMRELRVASSTAADVTSGLGINMDDTMGQEYTVGAVNSGTAVNEMLASARGMIGEGKKYADMDAFLGSDDGTALRDAIGASGRRAGDVADRVLTSDSAIRRVGAQGVAAARTARNNQNELMRLAFLYTDGDVTALRLGNFTTTDPNERTSIMQQVNSLAAGRQQALSTLNSMYQGTRDPVSDTEFDRLIADVAGDREIIRGSSQDLAEDLAASFGVKMDGNEGLIQGLAGNIRTETDRRAVQLILGTQSTLSGIAESIGFSSGDDASKIAELRALWERSPDDERFSSMTPQQRAQMVRLLNFQDAAGLDELGLGADGTATSPSEIIREISDSLDMFSAGTPDAGAVRFPETMKVELTGTLDLKNGQLTAAGHPVNLDGAEHEAHNV